MSDGDSKEVLIQRILGHYAYCVGQGAGSKWIDSEAIGALLDRYRPPLEKMSKREMADLWEKDKFFLLQLFREIGRVAVDKSSGRPYITAKALVAAYEKVEKEADEIPAAGRWCEWDT